MVAEPDILPDNPLDLTEEKPLVCCAEQILLIDRDSPTTLILKCGACGENAVAYEGQPKNMRKGKGFLKNRRRVRRAMKKTLEDLIDRFNFRVITGTDMT
jgi:hypothetical protein